MNAYIKQKHTLNIKDAIDNNKDYFGNNFLLSLHEKAKRSTLIEMEDIYLLEHPFFDRYAFIGLFQVDLKSWEDNSIPLTQLGLYNAFKDRIISSPHFYAGELKEKIEEFKKKKKTKIIETYLNGNYDLIDYNEYKELKDVDRSINKIKDFNYDNVENLTTNNKKSKSKNITPIISTLDMLKMMSHIVDSESFDRKIFSEEIRKTISKIENKLEVFKEDEINSYSVEMQWCVRVYGSIEESVSYARWFCSKQEAHRFFREMQKQQSMSKIQSNMICIMP